MSAFVFSRDLNVNANATFGGTTTVTTPFVSTFRRTVVSANVVLTNASNADLLAVTDVTTNPPRSITLPEISTLSGNKQRAFTIVDESGGAGTNNITINRSGSDQILGNTSTTLAANYASIRLYSVPNAVGVNQGRWYIGAVVPS